MLRALALDGVRVSYVPRVIADFRMGGVSARDWRATLRGTMETLRSRREHLNAPPVDAGEEVDGALVVAGWRWRGTV